MERKKIILLVILLLVLVGLAFITLNSSQDKFCGTPYHVRDAQTGQCKLYVGCSLPVGVAEDPSCVTVLENKTDNHP